MIEVNLSFDEFLYKLKQEYEYHKNGGTDYRQETAGLSIEVALKVRNVHPFLNSMQSKTLVSNHFPWLDPHRKDDVAKMLRVLAKSMYIERTSSDEAKAYVDNKLKNKVLLK